jgi:hypothetical protein
MLGTESYEPSRLRRQAMRWRIALIVAGLPLLGVRC